MILDETRMGRQKLVTQGLVPMYSYATKYLQTTNTYYHLVSVGHGLREALLGSLPLLVSLWSRYWPCGTHLKARLGLEILLPGWRPHRAVGRRPQGLTADRSPATWQRAPQS